MIDQKTFYKIVCLTGALLSLALFASAPSLVYRTWTFSQFIKDYITGIIVGTICTIPYWLAIKFVKRD